MTRHLNKIYVAHNFAAREWLPDVVDKFYPLGYECTSTWIYDDSHTNGGSQRDSAIVDIDDIDRSDIFVIFTEQYGGRPGSGKYFELGYAFAQGLRVILVGEDTNCVFYALPKIERVKDVAGLLELLA